MKAAVFSDSHGNTENMRRAIGAFHPDCIIHLGDCIKDAERIAREYPELPMHAVAGNCDCGGPDSDIIDLEGVRILIAHGHGHNVKMDLDSFCNSVYFSGAALGLYGHTHRPLWNSIRGMQIMNPGSIGDCLHPTYGQIELENGAFSCKIVDLV